MKIRDQCSHQNQETVFQRGKESPSTGRSWWRGSWGSVSQLKGHHGPFRPFPRPLGLPPSSPILEIRLPVLGRPSNIRFFEQLPHRSGVAPFFYALCVNRPKFPHLSKQTSQEPPWPPSPTPIGSSCHFFSTLALPSAFHLFKRSQLSRSRTTIGSALVVIA